MVLFAIKQNKINFRLCHKKEKQKQRFSKYNARYKKNKQRGRFLNRYDFAYAGRDTANQLGKIAPNVIKNASGGINNIPQQRTQQAISEGGNDSERVLPKILRGAIEDVYQTPFRLPGNFDKKQLNELKKKFR